MMMDIVGGRIFYINSNSDETVKFYDSNFQEIANVAVGDSPAYYQITSEGTSGKAKYYVFDTTYTPTYTGKFYWTYKKNGSWVYEEVGTTDNLGSGKANTLKIMAVRDGEYITDTADTSSEDPTETIWWYINYMNTQKVGGCDDWFIGSFQDNVKLRNFMNDQSITGYGLSSGLLTSAEYDQDTNYAYAVKDTSGTFMYDKNAGTHKGCAIRTF